MGSDINHIGSLSEEKKKTYWQHLLLTNVNEAITFDKIQMLLWKLSLFVKESMQKTLYNYICIILIRKQVQPKRKSDNRQLKIWYSV